MAMKTSHIIEAIKNRNVKEVKALLDSGDREINVADELLRTPLHWAVGGKFEECVTRLERLKNIDVHDVSRHTTPFSLRDSYMGSESMINILNILLDHGAEIDCKDKDGMSPLHVALILNLTDGVEVLINRGADLNIQSKAGDTPLHCAAKNFNLDTVNMLLKNGANLMLRNNNGETVLHVAVRTCDRSIVRSLLLHGADVDAQDNSGKTPLHVILQRNISNESDVVEDLLDWGASPIIKDEDRKTPMDLNTPPSYGWMKHFIKLQCVDLQFPYNKIEVPYGLQILLSGYKQLCTEELAKLKTAAFGNQFVLDVFTKYNDPTFLSNSTMRKAIYSICFERKFPLYTMVLRAMFRHAEKRVPLLNIAQGVLIDLIDAHVPNEISRKIISHLSNEDINNMIEPAYNVYLQLKRIYQKELQHAKKSAVEEYIGNGANPCKAAWEVNEFSPTHSSEAWPSDSAMKSRSSDSRAVHTLDYIVVLGLIVRLGYEELSSD
ncbi:hypothetical protein J6590_034882 [Homalodisca vitripennis]|nr:hypothetical protein J6590_038085 [Homalodisca vitripennis]KAG8292689.1 hypothetical protein J6590_034882 [Homalodisca vitripennis]